VSMTHRRRTPGPFLIVGSLLLACVTATVGLVAQSKRDVGVTAVKYQFRITGSDRAEIQVAQDDLVRITLSSEDIPHSFTLPDYRIQKRVEPGRDVTFEFRAEKAGRFEFHCSLTTDNCRERGMVGVLIVSAKQ
jgi:heme/copper-type cytochrome/quinol oxidase subunit 2